MKKIIKQIKRINYKEKFEFYYNYLKEIKCYF